LWQNRLLAFLPERYFSIEKPLKVGALILLALVLIVLAYVIYVFAAYYRVEDMQKLGVAHCDAASAAPMEGAPQTGVTYRVFDGQRGLRRVQRRLQLLHGRRQGEPRPQQAGRRRE